MSVYITKIRSHKNITIMTQANSIEWLSKYHSSDHLESFKKYSVSTDYINSRLSYATGVGNYDSDQSYLYKIGESESPSMNDRAQLAQAVCDKIFDDLYEDENDSADFINHISCTHYQSPSAAQKIVVKKEMEEKTIVTHLYHMGCYAAFPALRISKSYISDGAKKVDNVHTELCSFHLDRDQTSPDQIIMKTLFADGAIKYSVVSEDYFNNNENAGFEILALHEKIIPNSDKEMSWLLGSKGFIMGLTKNVPIFIAKKIENYMRELFDRAGLNYDQDKEDAIFAVHPGGPKIIELVEKMLKLTPPQVKHSKEVLFERGNMSSATVGHIWENIINDQSLKNKNVVSVAFGPGLTITGAVFKICRR